MSRSGDRRSKRSGMAEAMHKYRQTWGDTEPGMLRHGKNGFYHLPRWVDNWEFLWLHLLARAQGKCPSCHMKQPLGREHRRQYHKPDCYGGARFVDHLRRVHLWPREKFDL